MAVAKKIVNAIRAIENFQGDPEMIFNDCSTEANRDPSAIQQGIAALRRYYILE